MDYLALAQRAINGHGANQNEWELTQLIAVLAGQPRHRVAVEIGCDRGGTLWLWQQRYGQVIGVTLHTRADGSFDPHGADVIVGDSRSDDAREQLTGLLHGREADMVFIDGDHHAEVVNADLELARQIAPGGVIVLHDIAGYHYQGDDCEVDLVWGPAKASGPYMEIVAGEGTTPGTGILFPAPR